MDLLTYKIILTAIPIGILILGLCLVFFLVFKLNKHLARIRNSVCGCLFIHPDNGGGHKLLLYDKELAKPQLRPFWFRPPALSIWDIFLNFFDVPFYYFYEKKVDTSVIQAQNQCYVCACGYKAEGGKAKMQFHAHTMWSKNRRMAEADYKEKHHSVAEPVTTVATNPTFTIEPYDVDADCERSNIIMTPFDIFELNNWADQKEFMPYEEHKIAHVITLTAGVILAISSLFIVYLTAADKDSVNEEVQANTQIEVVK